MLCICVVPFVNFLLFLRFLSENMFWTLWAKRIIFSPTLWRFRHFLILPLEPSIWWSVVAEGVRNALYVRANAHLKMHTHLDDAEMADRWTQAQNPILFLLICVSWSREHRTSGQIYIQIGLRTRWWLLWPKDQMLPNRWTWLLHCHLPHLLLAWVPQTPHRTCQLWKNLTCAVIM